MKLLVLMVIPVALFEFLAPSARAQRSSQNDPARSSRAVNGSAVTTRP